MDQLGSGKFFTSLDLSRGYWQCHKAKEDIPKTAFLTQYRLCKWVVILMGLTNAPAMFMQTMNNLFMDLLDKAVVVFLDDILIYSTTIEEHFELLEKVFTCLCKHALYCNQKKCSIVLKTTTFLGFNITPEGMHISDVKAQSLKG